MELKIDQCITLSKKKWVITAFLRPTSKSKWEFFGERKIGDVLYPIGNVYIKKDNEVKNLSFCSSQLAEFVSLSNSKDVEFISIWSLKKEIKNQKHKEFKETLMEKVSRFFKEF